MPSRAARVERQALVNMNAKPKCIIAGMVSVVVEAAFQHQTWKPQLPLIMQAGDPVIVVCSVAPDIAAQRHLQRGLDDPSREHYHGDKRVSIYRETGALGPAGRYETPDFDVPTIHVSTRRGYPPGIEEIVARIRSSHCRGGAAASPTCPGDH
jgi:hypothetical protein